jgi:SAM-dependent methyltransferase
MDDAQYASRMAARHGMVGPADLWEMKRRFQIDFLKGVGLRPDHHLLDLGCGTMRGGIPLIQYLDVGHYTGVDVRPAVLEEGCREIEENGLVGRQPQLLCCEDLREFQAGRCFDVIWAFAVLIHMPDSVLDGALEAVARHLEPAGIFYATANIDERTEGTWQGFPVVSRTMAFYQEAVARHGLTLDDLGSLNSLGHVHPRLSEKQQACQRMLRITPLHNSWPPSPTRCEHRPPV